MKMKHSFKTMSLSPMPILTSMNIFLIFNSIIILLMKKNNLFLLLNILLMLLTLFIWSNSVLSEHQYLGYYHLKFFNMLKEGMMFFIFSEFMFFFTFFWSFLYYSFTTTSTFGLKWFCLEKIKMDFLNIPLLNTFILLFSGFILTLCHMKMLLMKKMNNMLLFMTILLGAIFLTLQLFEYKESNFSISDSVFGNCFFLFTSFHGIHVMLGFSLLTICYLYSTMSLFSEKKMTYFEISSWYWHFVDVIWLILYFLIYTWNMSY